MAQDKMRVIDYTSESGMFVEIPMEVLRARLYEIIAKLQEDREKFLDLVKENIVDLDAAVIILFSIKTGVPLNGKSAVAEDSLNRAAALDKKLKSITTFANSFTMIEKVIGTPHLVKLTVDQAKEFGL